MNKAFKSSEMCEISKQLGGQLLTLPVQDITTKLPFSIGHRTMFFFKKCVFMGQKAPIPADRLEGKRWEAAHVGEDGKQQSAHAFLVGAQSNGTVTVGISIWDWTYVCIQFRFYMSDRNVCIFLPKVLHINVHSSTILISPKVEVTRTPTKGWMNQ